MQMKHLPLLLSSCLLHRSPSPAASPHLKLQQHNDDAFSKGEFGCFIVIVNKSCGHAEPFKKQSFETLLTSKTKRK